jgi:hypothetical protein
VYALRAPVLFGQVADQILLGDAYGSVGLEVALDVFLDGAVLAGESGVAFACELMFCGIYAGDLLTCAGRWAESLALA